LPLLREARVAVHWPVTSRLERHLGLLTALCASGGEHRSVRPESTATAAAAESAATAATLGSTGCTT